LDSLLALAQVGLSTHGERDEASIFTRTCDGLAGLGLGSVLFARADNGWAPQITRGAGLLRARTNPVRRVSALDPLLEQAMTGAFALDREGRARLDAWGIGLSGMAEGTPLTAAALRIDSRGLPHAILVVLGERLAEGDLPALRLLAAQVSAAIDTGRTIADLSRRNQVLDALNRLAAASGLWPDLQSFFERGADEIARIFGCSKISLYLVDQGRQEVVRAHFWGSSTEEALRSYGRIPFGPGTLVGSVAMDGRTRVWALEDYPEPARSTVKGLELLTVAGIPLRARSTVVGVVTVGFVERRSLDQSELDLLEAMGAHFASAAETQRLLRDLRGRVGELTLLNEIALSSAAMNPVLLLENALRQIANTFQTEVSAAFLAEGDELVLSASLGLPESIRRPMSHLPKGHGLVGRAVTSLAPVRVASADDVPAESRALVEQTELARLVALPLMSKGKAMGALLVGRRQPRDFNASEVSILEAVAAQAAVAVENARLFADTRRRVQDLEAVNALAQRVLSSPPGDSQMLLRSACEEIARALGVFRASVLLSNEAGSAIREVARWSLEEPSGGWGETAALHLAGSPLAAEVLWTQRPASSPDLSTDSKQRVGKEGLSCSALLVPLTSRGALLGVIAVCDPPGRRFGDAEIALLSAMASQVAVGLENTELYAEARRRVEELSLVHEVGRSVAGTLDLDRVLTEGVEALAQLVDASHCLVYFHDPQKRELVAATATANARKHFMSMRLSLDVPSIAGASVRERRPILSEDAANDPRAWPPMRDVFGARSLMAAPLLLRDEPLGTVVVLESRRARQFTAAEVERVMAVCNQLAVAIENARLYSEARRRAEELGLLFEMGKSLVATLELTQVLDAGVVNLTRIVDTPDAFLLLADAEGKFLEVRAVAGKNTHMMGHRFPLDPADTALATLVFHEKKAIAVEDITTDPRVNPDNRPLTQARGLLALPLVVRDRAIGSAVICDPRAPRLFNAADIDRAQAIANQLAVAVENARLYEDLRKSYADLARAQAQLVHRERLAALGELSAVVAHEVRNPLGVIFNSLGSLRRIIRTGGDAQMLLDILGEEADRLNRIVGDLLDFARPPMPNLQPEPLDRVIEEAVSAAMANGGPAIRVERELDPKLPPIPMDARLLRQAILNIAMNAVQAMQKGGLLSVRAAPEPSERGRVVRIEIGDTGPGIPPETRARIFEPFFTTKATGTGLGLAVVRRIVEGHRGEITVSSEVGAGTTFTIRLPADNEPLAAHPGGQRAPAVGPGLQ
jgi:GAF domain-containing protein